MTTLIRRFNKPCMYSSEIRQKPLFGVETEDAYWVVPLQAELEEAFGDCARAFSIFSETNRKMQ